MIRSQNSVVFPNVDKKVVYQILGIFCVSIGVPPFLSYFSYHNIIYPRSKIKYLCNIYFTLFCYHCKYVFLSLQ